MFKLRIDEDTKGLMGVINFLLELPWITIIPILISLITVVSGIVIFRIEHREDRKWKQVEFLLKLNQNLLENKEIKDSIILLGSLNQKDGLKQLNSKITSDLIEKIWILLQFFDSLSECLDMKILSPRQLSVFGWHLKIIKDNKILSDYCENNGFSKVIDLANKIEHATYSYKK
jgi:hypothetical protein